MSGLRMPDIHGAKFQWNLLILNISKILQKNTNLKKSKDAQLVKKIALHFSADQA